MADKVKTLRIYRDEAGEFRWSAKAANGEIVAEGEGYEHLRDCRSMATSLFPAAVVELDPELLPREPE